MPSPFPGMDPYLEDPGLWPDVHHNLIGETQATLNRALSHRYVVRVEERVYLAEYDDEVDPVFRIPELRIAQGRDPTGPVTRTAESPLAVPLTMPTVVDVEAHEARLEIMDREGGSVVTVIEILSPSNKKPGSNGFRSFMEKRKEIVQSTTNWVEVDLLRRGRRTVPMRGRKHHYLIHVSPVEIRPNGFVWPVLRSQPLPTIRLPLRGTEEVSLSLQDVFQSAYDRAAYDRTIDYGQDPAVQLSESDAAWADALLKEKGLR